MRRGTAAAFLGLALTAANALGAEGKEESMAGGAFNLRIVSDSVPDWSSRENFVRSALSGWQTDHQKALAQFRWSYLGRRVGNCAYEDGRPVLDPIYFFNSYGITYCSMISEMNCALWEASGWPARCVNLPGHVVAEAFYGGAWHLFDNDFYNYFLNEKGAVASAEELEKSRIHGNVADLKPGEYYVFDHCPTASSPRGRIYMGPSSWSIIEVARDWYPLGQVKPRLDVVGAHAGHRYILGLRPNEGYTRHWRPLGTGDLYARPLNNGKGDPMAEASVMKNSRSNGIWEWGPDLSDPSVLFAAENVECSKDGLKAKDPGKPAFAVFRVMAANVVTSASITAEAAGGVKFSASGTGGLSWEDVPTEMMAKEGMVAGRCAAPIAGRLEYLLRASLGQGAVLKRLSLVTVTQVNFRTLPALKLGKNEIVAVSDEQLEYVTLNPRLTGGQHAKEVFKAEGWQSQDKPRDWHPSIRATEKAELVLKAAAPRDIKHVRMACTAHVTEPGAEFELSVNGGKEWKQLGKFEFKGAPYDRRISAETRDFPAGTREVLMRYAFDEGGSGLVNVFAEVGYEPAGGFMPYDVTYSWSEWRDGKWVEREHAERVKSAYHRYAVNVGGERPPKMNWLRIWPAGKGKLGYGDGEDVGTKAERPQWSVRYGELLSAGCKYEASRPASAAFPDTGGKLLTDAYLAVPSFWALGGIDLKDESKRNKKRVGELVVWEPGEELAVTVDLGEAKRVGGARICAVGPNPTVRFPEKMVVEVSADGKKFAPAGEARWEDCFFPPVEHEHWEGFDAPLYDGLQAGGIIDYRFPIIFDQPAQARYVRFRMAPQDGGKAGIGLWELEVYDKIEKAPWDEHLRLPEAPAAKGK